MRLGEEGGEEVRRLREVVRELERNLSEREVKEGGGGEREGQGGVVAATVRVERFLCRQRRSDDGGNGGHGSCQTSVDGWRPVGEEQDEGELRHRCTSTPVLAYLIRCIHQHSPRSG